MTQEAFDSADADKTFWTAKDDPDGYTEKAVYPADFYLDRLIENFTGPDDDHVGGIGMTFQIKGATVAGTVVSRAEWIQLFVAQVRSAPNADVVADRLERDYNEMHQLIIDERERRLAADLPPAARKYVHMKDVVIFAGDRVQNVALWRGKVRTIDGWSMGTPST